MADQEDRTANAQGGGLDRARNLTGHLPDPRIWREHLAWQRHGVAVGARPFGKAGPEVL